MRKVIDLPDIARRNAPSQRRYNLVGLPKVKIHQLAHQPGVAVAGGLELLQVHQRCGRATV